MRVFLWLLFLTSSLYGVERQSYKDQLANLDTLEFHGEGNLLISQGEENELILIGTKDCLGQVHITIENNKLIIRHKVGFFQRLCTDFSCQLKFKNLNNITLNGQVFLKSNEMHMDKLALSMYGNSFADITFYGKQFDVSMEGDGNLIIDGEAKEQKIEMRGSALYHANDLITEVSTINITGSGRANIFVDKELTVNINGDGSVYYGGKPEIHQNIHGTGKIINSPPFEKPQSIPQ